MTMKASKDNKQLSCHAEGNPAVNYKWIMPGSTVPQPGGNTIDMLEADNPDHYNDTYICIVENSVGTNSMNITAYAATSEVKSRFFSKYVSTRCNSYRFFRLIIALSASNENACVSQFNLARSNGNATFYVQLLANDCLFKFKNCLNDCLRCLDTTPFTFSSF